MLRFCTVLLLAVFFAGGLDASRICISDSGVAFGGHTAAQSCEAKIHDGLMALAETAGNCDECVDVAVNDVEQRQAADSMRDLRLDPVILLLAVLNERLHIVSTLRIETFYDTAAQSAATGYFNPLSTIVLRI